MASETFYFLATAAALSGPGEFFGGLQDSGAAPGPAAGCGWAVGTVAAPAYAAMQFGYIVAASAFTSSSQLTGPPGTHDGDSYCSQNQETLSFDAGTWNFSLSVMSETGGPQCGHFQIRLWASVNQDGSSARELTSGVVAGSECAALTSSFTPISANIAWSAPAINLSGEYLFVQMEWVIDVAGSSSGDDVHFYISDCTLVTANLNTGGYSGLISATESNDTADFLSSVGDLAALAAIEDNDTIAVAAFAATPAVLDAVEGADSMAMAANVAWLSILTGQEQSDIAAFTGTVSIPSPIINMIEAPLTAIFKPQLDLLSDDFQTHLTLNMFF